MNKSQATHLRKNSFIKSIRIFYAHQHSTSLLNVTPTKVGKINFRQLKKGRN